MSTSERGQLTSNVIQGSPNEKFIGFLRAVALIAVMAGAVGSLGLMLCADQRTPRFLLVLFFIWVLSPFVALAWANVVSKRWSVLTPGSALLRDARCHARLFGLLRKTCFAAPGIRARFRVRGRSAGVMVAYGDRVSIAALMSRGRAHRDVGV